MAFQLADRIAIAVKNQTYIIPLGQLIYFISQPAHTNPVVLDQFAALLVNQVLGVLDVTFQYGFFKLWVENKRAIVARH